MALEFKRLSIQASASAAMTGHSPKSIVSEIDRPRVTPAYEQSGLKTGEDPAGEHQEPIAKLQEKIAELEEQNQLFRDTFFAIIELLEDNPDGEQIREITEILKSVVE